MKKSVALTLAAGVLFLAGCSTAHNSARLEYKIQTVFLPAGFMSENTMDGWQYDSASAVSSDPSRVAIIFKRQAQ